MKIKKEDPGKNRYKKVEKGSFQYYLVLGLFIVNELISIFFLYNNFDLSSWMTRILFFSVCIWMILIYCWLNEDKWDKLENVLGPLIEDFGMSLFIIIPLVATIYYIYCIINGDKPMDNALGLIIMIIFLLFDFYMLKKHIMTFNFVDYLKNRKNK